MYEEDLALNNLQWLICHKTLIKPNNKRKKKAYINVLNEQTDEQDFEIDFFLISHCVPGN